MNGLMNSGLGNLNKSIQEYIQRLHDNGHKVNNIKHHDAGVTLNVTHEGNTPIGSIPGPIDHRMVRSSLRSESKIYLLNDGNTQPPSKGSLA